jgi:hypothetical protein
MTKNKNLTLTIPPKQFELLKRLKREKSYADPQDIIRSLIEKFLKEEFPTEF